VTLNLSIDLFVDETVVECVGMLTIAARDVGIVLEREHQM
jgi:hypothetical protein